MEKREILQFLAVLEGLPEEEEGDEKKISFWVKFRIKITRFFIGRFPNYFIMLVLPVIIGVLISIIFLTLIDSETEKEKVGLIMASILLAAGLLLFVIIYFLVSNEAKKIEKKLFRKTKVCLECQDKKVRKDFPYCSQCFQQAILKTSVLREETESKVRKALELGLKGQAEGSINYFLENLPGLIKFLIEKKKKVQAERTLEELRKVFPQAQLFSPNGFEKYPLDSNEPAVNIPLLGLEVLEKFGKLLDLLDLKGKPELKQIEKGGENK